MKDKGINYYNRLKINSDACSDINKIKNERRDNILHRLESNYNLLNDYESKFDLSNDPKDKKNMKKKFKT